MATTTTVRERSLGPAWPRHRFTVDDYHRMIEAEILTERDRVELLGGEIVEMSAKGRRHNGSIIALTRGLQERLGRSAVVSVQNSLLLSDESEPEPDVAVLRPREDNYMLSLARAEDILVLIEVSDTSLEYDRGEKLPRYARAGVPESWIVDLTREGDAIERHSGPDRDTGAYGSVVRFGRGQEIVSAVLSELSLAVHAVLGPPPTA